jgi:hypothetical protein
MGRDSRLNVWFVCERLVEWNERLRNIREFKTRTMDDGGERQRAVAVNPASASGASQRLHLVRLQVKFM